MSDYHNKRALEIVTNILYVTIASVSPEGQPWNSPVYSAFDEKLNFYWFSDKNAQHSKNLRQNDNAFLVIYDSTVPESTGEGVYIQAKVQELDGRTEALTGLSVMDKRVGKVKVREFKNFSGEAPLRVFRAKPLKVWMNDDDKDAAGNYVKDVRVEVPLDVLKGDLAQS